MVWLSFRQQFVPCGLVANIAIFGEDAMFEVPPSNSRGHGVAKYKQCMEAKPQVSNCSEAGEAAMTKHSIPSFASLFTDSHSTGSSTHHELFA